MQAPSLRLPTGAARWRSSGSARPRGQLRTAVSPDRPTALPARPRRRRGARRRTRGEAAGALHRRDRPPQDRVILGIAPKRYRRCDGWLWFDETQAVPPYSPDNRRAGGPKAWSFGFLRNAKLRGHQDGTRNKMSQPRLGPEIGDYSGASRCAGPTERDDEYETSRTGMSGISSLSQRSNDGCEGTDGRPPSP